MHSIHGDVSEQLIAAERKVQIAQKFYAKVPNAKTQRMVEDAETVLAQLQTTSLPGISFSDGTVMTLHPRPGLQRSLSTLKSMATLYILSHGSPAYLAKAVPALGIERYFKGVISTKGGRECSSEPSRQVGAGG